MKELNKKIIKEKLNYFLKNKKKVHITKTNNRFINGYLLKKISSEIFLIEDDEGRKMEVFISEISDINSYSSRENCYD